MRALGTIVFVLVLAAAIGGGAYFFWQKFFHTERVLMESVASFADMQTAHVDLSYKRAGDGATPFGFVEFEGDVDFSAAPDVLLAGRAELAVSPRSGSEHLVMDVRVKEGFAIRYDRAPEVFVRLLESAGVSPKEWQKLAGWKDVGKLFVGTNDVGSLSSAQKFETLRTLIKTTDWFAKTEATWTEIVHGRATRVVSVSMKPEAVEVFAKTWFALLHDRTPNEEELQRVNTLIQEWAVAQGTLWVDTGAKRIERMRFILADGTEWTLDLDRVNQPIEWDEDPLPSSDARTTPLPADATSSAAVEMPTATSTPEDPDGDGLVNEQELFYGTDPRVADTDSDGYSDGEEVRNGYNPKGTGALFNFGLPTL